MGLPAPTVVHTAAWTRGRWACVLSSPPRSLSPDNRTHAPLFLLLLSGKNKVEPYALQA